MSSFGVPQSQLEVVYQPEKLPPTYSANIVQTWVVDEDVYLDFCLRSPDKPHIRADVQCRVVTSMSNLKRLAQGLTSLVARWEELTVQAESQRATSAVGS